jgi:putative Mg2+ transporter-C (MgtC) family protein
LVRWRRSVSRLSDHSLFEVARSWWARAAAAIRTDFSDLPDAGQAASLVIRLLMAALLGGALGYDRERAGKSAGIRTHMLVALGAALFVLIPQQAGVAPGDITRVLQGIVAGIGFLGAGTILKDDDRGEVRGLTTGAGVWLTAAIGVAAERGHRHADRRDRSVGSGMGLSAATRQNRAR